MKTDHTDMEGKWYVLTLNITDKKRHSKLNSRVIPLLSFSLFKVLKILNFIFES